jgi:hypothetical protein
LANAPKPNPTRSAFCPGAFGSLTAKTPTQRLETDPPHEPGHWAQGWRSPTLRIGHTIQIGDPALRSKKIDRGQRDWYQLERHRKRAKAQLQHEPFCALCAARGIATPARIADHVEPHRGDWNAFRTGKLQSLCWRCHSSTKQLIELHGYDPTIGIDGFPIDQSHPVYQSRSLNEKPTPAFDVTDLIG